MSALDRIKQRAVIQGPFGSMIREEYGIDNANPDEIFSMTGQAALALVLTKYKEAGATLGGSPTFRLTDFRARTDEDWEFDPGRQLNLSDETRERNRLAVEIARKVYGLDIVGLVSPVSDTSGADDERWKALGRNKVDWAMQRQRPQLAALRAEKVDVVWGEAFRYHDEAIAMARLARELAFSALVINFEANDQGVPDPGNGSGTYRFREMKKELQTEAGDDVEVFVGANCTGVKNLDRIWGRGDLIDVAYPNSLDFGDHEKATFARLVETPDRTGEENAKIARLEADHHTSLERFVKFWRSAFQNHGVLVAAGCCGTTPAHTWVARQALNEAQTRAV